MKQFPDFDDGVGYGDVAKNNFFKFGLKGGGRKNLPS